MRAQPTPASTGSSSPAAAPPGSSSSPSSATSSAAASKRIVTLVERNRAHLWKPLLHSVAAGSLSRAEHELNYLAQAHWHHFTYRYGEVVGLDRANKQLLLGPTHDDEGREITPATGIPYDTLVMAIGSITNDFGTKGAAEFAVPLETAEQASRFNRRLVNACLRANAQDDPIRPGQLHVAIIGAGATGTELAAELHRTVRAVVAYGLDRIDPARDIRIKLIEAAPRILPALPERISAATTELLRGLDVDVRTASQVSEVRADGVVLDGGEFIPAELVVWAAGVKAPDFLARFRRPRDQPRRTSSSSSPPSRPHATKTSSPSATAPPAPASPAARRSPPRPSRPPDGIPHGRPDQPPPRRQPLEPFSYRDFGSLVSLGKYSTVGSLMGFVVGRSMFVEGLFARLMYRSLYKMHEAALHGGARVALRTAAGLFSNRPITQVKLH